VFERGERQPPGRASDRDSGPWTEERSGPLKSRARVYVRLTETVPVTICRLGEARQNDTPMLLASALAGDGAVSNIREGVSDTSAAEPLAQAVRSAEIRRSDPIRTETDEKDNGKLADGRAPSCDATGETASHLYRRGKWNPM